MPVAAYGIVPVEIVVVRHAGCVDCPILKYREGVTEDRTGLDCHNFLDWFLLHIKFGRKKDVPVERGGGPPAYAYSGERICPPLPATYTTQQMT